MNLLESAAQIGRSVPDSVVDLAPSTATMMDDALIDFLRKPVKKLIDRRLAKALAFDPAGRPALAAFRILVAFSPHMERVRQVLDVPAEMTVPSLVDGGLRLAFPSTTEVQRQEALTLALGVSLAGDGVDAGRAALALVRKAVPVLPNDATVWPIALIALKVQAEGVRHSLTSGFLGISWRPPEDVASALHTAPLHAAAASERTRPASNDSPDGAPDLTLLTGDGLGLPPGLEQWSADACLTFGITVARRIAEHLPDGQHDGWMAQVAAIGFLVAIPAAPEGVGPRLLVHLRDIVTVAEALGVPDASGLADAVCDGDGSRILARAGISAKAAIERHGIAVPDELAMHLPTWMAYASAFFEQVKRPPVDRLPE